MSLKYNTEIFTEKAKKVHGNKYNYLKVKYVNIKTKVIIICLHHGEFKQRPDNHLSGHGCKQCLKYNTEIFIEKAKKVHGNKYDYSKVNYESCKTKVTIICSKHGEFEQLPNSHLKGHCCLHCSHNISKSSQDWLYSFNNINIIREKTIKVGKKRIRVDGFDPKTKTIYEFYGDYWHGNPNKFKLYDINLNNKKTFGELYNLTLEKERLIKYAGYNLITIWESEFIKEQNG